ncbi:hypothetical protein [Saccharothrix xinjiangensis]|uniref:Uncharacterized protein n=1 Tax=Saccharothrix xinjiangensis TaxID=204798 RepID=A0ABV9XQ48_9PSEU
MTEPFDQIPMAPHRLDARGRHLVAEVAERTGPDRRAVRWAVPGAVVLCALSGGVAVAAYVATQPAAVREQVRCYTEADPGGHRSDAVGVTLEGKPADVADEAVALCAELWGVGALTAGPASAQVAPGGHDPKAGPPLARRAIPPLAACVVSDGVAGVFPGGPGLCGRLGLPELGELDS